jgi:predicted CxxxxCH...CXXCH cytochrome family protein
MLAAAATLMIGSVASAGLLHNSDSVGTKYGTWGVTGGKYGAFTCATCHNKSTTNIKRVSGTLTAPLGNWSTTKATTATVVFNNVTGTIGASMGNDLGGHTTSTKVCEACHSKTAYHRYNTTDQTVLDHYNNRDCMKCHGHNAGFRAACNTCHGYPPKLATTGPDGLIGTPSATNATGGAAGAHAIHDSKMVCNTCHSGFNPDHKDAPTYNIQLGFDINASNVSGFGTTAVTTGSFTPNSAMFGKYSVVSSKAGTTINAEAAGKSTCSIYCHNYSATANGTLQQPDWTSASLGSQCGSCHGATAAAVPNAAQTGAHTRHAGSAAGGLSLACSNCHGTVADNTHVNGNVSWNVGNLNGASPTYRSSASNSTNALAPSASYGTCNNVYCHSTVQGASGTAAPTYVAATWGGSALNCTTSCHVGDNTLATGAHAKHVSAAGYGYTCATCHTGSGDETALHGNYVIEVSMPNGMTYTQANQAPGNGYGTCSTTVCHAGATAAPNWGSGALPADCSGCHGNKATAATRLTAPHNAHVNVPANGGGFACVDCHSNIISNDTTISAAGKALHVNTFVNVSGAYIKKQQAAAGAVTCSTESCHNSGKATTPRVAVTWNSSTIDCSGCHGSAGNVTGMPYPDAAGVNAHAKHMNNTTAAGDAARCIQCHDTTVNGSNAIITGSAHLNKARDVRFSKVNTYAAYSGNWSSAGRTCTATYCHGGTNAATPTWGTTTLACNACHLALMTTGAHVIHNNAAATSYTTAPGTSSTSTTAYNFNCSTCHGVDTAQHIDYPKSATSDATIFFGFSSAGRGTAATTAYVRQASGSTDAQGFKWTSGGTGNCTATYCHSNGRGANGLSSTVNWSMTARNTSCATCHGSTTTVASNGLSAAHYTHMNLPAQGGGYGCVDCHANTASNNTTIATNGFGNHVNKMVNYSGLYAGPKQTAKQGTLTCTSYCHTNGSGGQTAITWSSTIANCSGCHGTTDTTGKGMPATGNHAVHMARANDCFMCHNTSTTAASSISSVANHINRASVPAAGGTWNPGTAVPVTFTVGGSVGSRTCSATACHGTSSPAATWGGTLDCNGCHPLAGLSGGTNSGHARHMGVLTASQVKFYVYTANKSPNAVEGTTVSYGFGCVNCHPDTVASHFNGRVDVVLNHTLGAAVDGTLASKTTSGATVNGTVGSGTVTCTATYCHGNGVANVNTTPAWNGAFTGDRCANCHLNSPTTNAHTAHTVGIHFDDIFDGRSGKLPQSGATTVNAAHGAGNRATTMDCYVCHNSTINVAGNDKNTYCVTCHVAGNTVGAAVTRTAKITNLLGHVNGATEVAFVPTAIKTKAQLRDGSFDSYTSLAEGQWKRNRGYKNYTSSYDYTYQTLAARAAWTKGTATCATVACHGGASPVWNTTPLTCDSCHSRL